MNRVGDWEQVGVDISGWIAHWASWTPDKVALRFEAHEIRYGELEQDVAAVAAWLRAHGISAGDRVAYLGPNCPELLDLLFACARQGAIFVPLNNRMPAEELRVFVAATQPRLLIAEESFREVGQDSMRDQGRDRLKTFIVGELSRSARRTVTTAATSNIGLTGPVLILFTSGSTGRPKGATFTNQNLAFNALNVMTALGLRAADEILTPVPMFHSGGLFIHTTPGLCAGATITIHREFDPGQVIEEIQSQRITLLPSVPAMTFALARHPAWGRADLSSLRCVVTGSTMVPRGAVEAWQARRVSVVQGYGSTEACPTAVTLAPGSAAEAAFTAGKPVLYSQVRIVDESGHEVPVGEPGEVWIRGPAVMHSYWNNEQATREAFREGWFRNGDVGLIDEHGYLHIVGRLSDTIIVGASNVYPSDLEAVLEACPEIREAAVVGRPHEQLGEVPVACVVPTRGSTLTTQQVLALFKNRLAVYKQPRDVLLLDALPRNWHGKIDRRRLHQMVATAAAVDPIHPAPCS